MPPLPVPPAAERQIARLPESSPPHRPPTLARRLNLPLLFLYGLGTTIGAGIYVLVGAAAGRAGMYAPLAFLLAAVAILPTAASYGELAGRFPVSAGEAAYVQRGLRRRWLAGLTGWLVAASGIVAAGAIAIGCAGYVRAFVEVDVTLAVVVILLATGALAAWGILESVLAAALFTLIEAGGLVAITVAGVMSGHIEMADLARLAPSHQDGTAWLAVIDAGLLAVFAFIGFEGLVNVAEETKAPARTMPWAIFLTLGATTALYLAVTATAVLAIEPAVLAASTAPLSDVFVALTGLSALPIAAIAVFATLNTILIQIIMASRVLFGMAKRGLAPGFLAAVSARTRTPLVATGAVVVVSLSCALLFDLHGLAEATSLAVLATWVLINAALVALKLRGDSTPKDVMFVPIGVPILGLVFSAALILSVASRLIG